VCLPGDAMLSEFPALKKVWRSVWPIAVEASLASWRAACGSVQRGLWWWDRSRKASPGRERPVLSHLPIRIDGDLSGTGSHQAAVAVCCHKTRRDEDGRRTLSRGWGSSVAWPVVARAQQVTIPVIGSVGRGANNGPGARACRASASVCVSPSLMDIDFNIHPGGRI
jgi:hypothetical protein